MESLCDPRFGRNSENQAAAVPQNGEKLPIPLAHLSVPALGRSQPLVDPSTPGDPSLFPGIFPGASRTGVGLGCSHTEPGVPGDIPALPVVAPPLELLLVSTGMLLISTVLG